MAEIGTPGWLDALARSVADLDAGGVRVAVLHRVEGGPSWVVAAEGEHVTARAAAADEPADVTFTWQADDARAVAAGEASPLAVFQAGRVRIGGDLRRLPEATALFARFPGVAVPSAPGGRG